MTKGTSKDSLREIVARVFRRALATPSLAIRQRSLHAEAAAAISRWHAAFTCFIRPELLVRDTTSFRVGVVFADPMLVQLVVQRHP